jgi:hypothetical protein
MASLIPTRTSCMHAVHCTITQRVCDMYRYFGFFVDSVTISYRLGQIFRLLFTSFVRCRLNQSRTRIPRFSTGPY